MKIAITADNHLDFLYQGEALVLQMMGDVAAEKCAFMLNLGDFTNGRLYTDYRGLDALLADENVLYVLGNHDLWSHNGEGDRTPDEAHMWMTKWLQQYGARSLELGFSDDKTLFVYGEGDAACCVVGTMGFPDFKHPQHHLPLEVYERKRCTNDSRYIDLSSGWTLYTKQIVSLFEKRLSAAIASGAKRIVVATHYPIFESQCHVSREIISAYFFCHGLGVMVKKVAAKHPDVKFWCFAGHSHDYCYGKLFAEADNVASVGMLGEYGKLAYAMVDLEGWVDQPFETKWLPKPCEIVVETVVHETRRIS